MNCDHVCAVGGSWRAREVDVASPQDPATKSKPEHGSVLLKAERTLLQWHTSGMSVGQDEITQATGFSGDHFTSLKLGCGTLSPVSRMHSSAKNSR